MEIVWIFAILIIFFCGIGVVVSLGIAAERIDDLMRGEHRYEDIER